MATEYQLKTGIKPPPKAVPGKTFAKKTGVAPAMNIGRGGARYKKVVMGYAITHKHKFNTVRPNARPFSWKPLFEALQIGESIQVEKARIKTLKWMATKYSKRMKPKQFIFETDFKTGGGWLGRIK